MRRPRILLSDDCQMIADLLKLLLADRYEVVGALRNTDALLDAAIDMRPDAVVMNVNNPPSIGLDAGEQIKKLVPSAKLIFLAMNVDPHLVKHAVKIGAAGFVCKQESTTELLRALDRVLHGCLHLSPAAANAVATLCNVRPKYRRAYAGPTPRQCEVIRLIAEGLTLGEIAAELNISTRTAAAHKYSAMENLFIKSSAELVRYAVSSGILSMRAAWTVSP